MMDKIDKMIQLEGGNAVLVRGVPEKDCPGAEDSTGADEAIKPWWAAALDGAVEEQQRVTRNPVRAKIPPRENKVAIATRRPRYGGDRLS